MSKVRSSLFWSHCCRLAHDHRPMLYTSRNNDMALAVQLHLMLALRRPCTRRGYASSTFACSPAKRRALLCVASNESLQSALSISHLATAQDPFRAHHCALTHFAMLMHY